MKTACRIIAAISFLSASLYAGRLDSLIVPPKQYTGIGAEKQMKVQEPEAAEAPVEVAAVEAPIVPEVEYTLSSDQLKADICDFLAKRYHLDGQLAIYPVTPLQDLALEEPEYELVFTSLPASRLNPQISVRFHIESGGRIVARYSTAMRVEHWVKAYAARSSLDRMHPLSQGDVSVIDVDTLRQRLPLVSVEDPINLYEVVNRIDAGEPILAKQLALRPQIRRGELVEVHASEGALQITLKAIALEDGKTGDFIRMRNPISRKEFQAQITHENMVRVFF